MRLTMPTIARPTLRLGLISALSLTASVAAFAQGDQPQPLPAETFAAVDSSEQLIIAANGGATVVTDPLPAGLASSRWNADGTLLAYTVYDAEYQAQLYVVGADGQNPILLANTGQVDPSFPITFTPDGDVAYISPTEFPADAGADFQYVVNLNRIAPETDAQPELVAAVPFDIGCGGGSIYPSDARYSGEAGSFGNGLLLEWTEAGVLYSTNCAGNGFALLNTETNEIRYFTPYAEDSLENGVSISYGRPQISPDGSAVALIRLDYTDPENNVGTLAIVDTATGELTEIGTAQSAVQVAWGPNGTLFYSTRAQTSDLTANLDDAGRANFEAALGGVGETPAYQSTIIQLDPATGEEAEVYSLYAYQIGRMAMNADQSAFYFSAVANLDAWVAGVADGSLTYQTDPTGAMTRAASPVQLYRLPLVNGLPTLGSENPLVGNFAQFVLAPA